MEYKLTLHIGTEVHTPSNQWLGKIITSQGRKKKIKKKYRLLCLKHHNPESHFSDQLHSFA